MPLLQPNPAPSPKDLRWFAALWWPAMCGAIGMMFFRKFHAPITGVGVWAGGGLLAVLGIMAPSVIRPVYIGLIRLTYPIGWCVSHGVLAGIYFLILTPIGALVRLFHDPMERQFERKANSYWVSRETFPIDHYFRQL